MEDCTDVLHLQGSTTFASKEKQCQDPTWNQEVFKTLCQKRQYSVTARRLQDIVFHADVTIVSLSVESHLKSRGIKFSQFQDGVERETRVVFA